MYKLSFEVINVIFFPKWLHAFFKLVLQTICWLYKVKKTNKQTNKPLTVKLTKPWTPEIFMECYCVARNKPIRREITKPQTATVISLWFWGFLAYPELYCNWPVHNQHSWNFSGVHGFLSLTVSKRTRENKIISQNQSKFSIRKNYKGNRCKDFWNRFGGQGFLMLS